ncbi:MAG: bifunctional hydroxymethylpyrimidine kinase/phosphomethylpyrimidine kinase [Acidimicrobiales bacterium]
MEPITALTIAGSDSGGGAGLQADLRTFSAFGAHGTTAVTAVTAQNTQAVTAVTLIDPVMVVAQVEAVLADFAVAAVKTGMLGQSATVEAVATLAGAGRLPHLVVDPVLLSSTGHALMSEDGPIAYREALVPLATIVTPNLREAAVLCGVEVRDVTTLEHMRELAETIRSWGPRYVLVKGGHFAAATAREERSPDLLVSADGVVVYDAPRVATRNDHGTGCSLSAAICAGLGLGRSVPDAVRDAKSFVLAALTSAASWRLGRGHGPIDHLGWNG